jgi:hypothetical protein
VVDVDRFLSGSHREFERTAAEACPMNQLARQIEATVGSRGPGERIGVGSEAQLRIAAATVSDAPPGMITAATVVAVGGQDDAAAIESLIGEIANEFRLKTELRVHLGSFSVRFSRAQNREK